MPHEKQYASYKSLAPKEDNGPKYTCMEMQDLQHRKKMLSENTLICIDLFADWCEPCKVIGPQFANLAQQYNIPGKCLLAKENVDLELTRDYQITGIPAFIFYHNGRLVREKDGNPVQVVGGDIGKVQQILDKFLPQLK
jgi:thiol-disulfide isomerase/thioredoxin